LLTVSGLNDSKLPPDNDLVLKIPRLCIGQLGIGGDAQFGYVAFTRKESGSDKKWFIYYYYKDEVLIPLINKMHENYVSYNTSAGMTIPDRLTVVARCDGDMSQVKAVASNQLFGDNITKIFQINRLHQEQELNIQQSWQKKCFKL
jgi:hypothetical protein